jgi:hypothetical protein
MGSGYAVILGMGSSLPDRGLLLSQAWGDVPVSYIQDHEDTNECTFLDLKVNKWEVNSQWSNKQVSEPWIRIEMLKGQALEQYMRGEGLPFPIEVEHEALMIFELDEGGTELDEMLLLRLLSVFCGSSKVYRLSNCIEDVSESIIDTLPSCHTVRELLIKCE